MQLFTFPSADFDYIPLNMVKTLVAGACEVCYSIEIIPDTARESSEIFYGQFQVINMTEVIALYGSKVTVLNDYTMITVHDASTAG